MTETVAIIVAAGRGTRAPGDTPKQYRPVGGQTVLARAVNAFLGHSQVDKVLVVIHADDVETYRNSISEHEKLLRPVFGGTSRAESVLNGLRSLCGSDPDAVLVHDAARPLTPSSVISRVINALCKADGAVPTLPAVDAMRRVSEAGRLAETVPRDAVHRAQTPQGFHFTKLIDAFEAVALNSENGDLNALASVPDEADLAINAGLTVISVDGDPLNFKLTLPEDFLMANRLLNLPDIRTGQGYDVHAFEDGTEVTLCGVTIPHNRALRGHSDADVGLHAITDALLGAVAQGDIGRHFSPSDPQWKGTDSAVFLRRVVEIVAEQGYAISNLDATLICEEPKIGPHAAAMISRVAELCGLDVDRVSIKATTSEQLGFTGRREGIAAQAIATVIASPDARPCE